MVWRIALIGAFVALAACAQASDMTSQVTELDNLPRVKPDYPVPREPNQIFYIERSSNSNTVVYCANIKDGKLDPDKPVIAYWRWYNVDGHKKPLNFIERMLAYGVTSVNHNGPDGSYSFKIAAFPERTVYVRLDAKGHPEAFGRVGDRWVRLVYVYLQVDDSGLLPNVPSLDFYGYDMATGKALHEHIIRH